VTRTLNTAVERQQATTTSATEYLELRIDGGSHCFATCKSPPPLALASSLDVKGSNTLQVQIISILDHNLFRPLCPLFRPPCLLINNALSEGGGGVHSDLLVRVLANEVERT
jgi:hypothetical protein